MSMSSINDRRLGVAIVGFGGAVSTTAVAGCELLRLGLAGHDGLPLADAEGLVPYANLVFSGWDVHDADLASAAEHHGVLDTNQLAAIGPGLARLRPWPAVSDTEWCRGVDGLHRSDATGHRARVEAIRADLRAFREEGDLDDVVVINLASTERWPDPAAPALQTIDAFEAGLDAGDEAIGPGMLYAYAAIREGCPFGNFTPNMAADVPALLALALQEGVPVAGKDGKTGQTFVKTVLAPGFRARALRVRGWFSTNILGNRDGEALHDKDSLSSKLATKAEALDSILGYPVEDHVVSINYYRPRGDEKEAWDTIDLVGFLGRPMQIKVNFLCRDSILAAPLVLEIARTLHLASRTGEAGAQEQLSAFFKAPMTADGGVPEHALHRQEERLRDWLAAAVPTAV